MAPNAPAQPFATNDRPRAPTRPRDDDTPSHPRVLAPLLSAWTLGATGFALSGVVTVERAFVVPALVATLTAAQLVAYARSARLRRALAALDVRWLVGLHALRAPIGLSFLWLHARGALPGVFALRAGWGDLAAGLGALGVVALHTARGGRPRTRALALAWNALGLADITLVLLTVQYLLFVARRPQDLAALLRFPGPLLPSLVVPLVLATHAYLFARLRGAHRTR